MQNLIFLLLAVFFLLLWVIVKVTDDGIIKDGRQHRFDEFSWKVFLLHGGGWQIAVFLLAIAMRTWFAYQGLSFRWYEPLATIVFLLGWPVWEVIVHKYEMHTWKSDPLYDVHQIHHRAPYDSKFALVPFRQILFFMVLQFTYAWLQLPTIMTIHIGVMGMLCLYEYMHYGAHTNKKPRTRYGRWVQSNHRNHHFANEDSHMGLLFPFKWGDKI